MAALNPPRDHGTLRYRDDQLGGQVERQKWRDEDGPRSESESPAARPDVSRRMTAAGTSFAAINQSELLDFRAAQRTFDMAYLRTSLGGLSFSLTVLRFFEPSFQSTAIIYAILSLGVGADGLLRGKMVMKQYRNAAKLRSVAVAADGSRAAAQSFAHGHQRRRSHAGQFTETQPLLPQNEIETSVEEVTGSSIVVVPLTFFTAGGIVGPVTMGMILLELSILIALLVDLP